MAPESHALQKDSCQITYLPCFAPRDQLIPGDDPLLGFPSAQ